MGFSIDAATARLLLAKVSDNWVGAYNKAEKEIIRIIATRIDRSSERSGWSLVVWTLKREVRAFGECLGMQRR
jgi:hypothetical protein